MATKILRIIKYGFQNFIRNSLLSLATIIVLVMALVVFEGLMIFQEVTNTTITSLKDKIDISVFFKTNISEDEVLKVKKDIESLKEVKAVEYVSRDKALESFKAKYESDPKISQALIELGNNPFFASLNIKANNPDDYAGIVSYMKSGDIKEMIEDLTFEESKLVIDRLSRFISIIQNIGLALTLFLALTAVLITFNTIRLAIYSNREEIGIMRLVGASNSFINGPYIIESVIFGILAALFSLLIIGPFINFAADNINSFIPEIDIRAFFYGNLFKIFFYELLFGSLLSIVSGIFAIRKYIKI